MGDKDGGKKAPDPRMEYIFSRVMSAFGITKGKLDKVKAAVAASELSGTYDGRWGWLGGAGIG